MPNSRLPSVLIIEDDDNVRSAIVTTLRDSGWQAFEAADGLQGLAHLKNGLTPTIILLDVMMPNMNGAELMDTLRQDPIHSQIPVIQTSAVARSPIPGISARLDKPFTVERLLHVMSTYSRWAQQPSV